MSFTLDLTVVNRQFTAGSHGNVPTVVTDSQGRETNKFQRFVTRDDNWLTLEFRHPGNEVFRAIMSLQRSSSKSRPKSSC
jgi:hypothetical protein